MSIQTVKRPLELGNDAAYSNELDSTEVVKRAETKKKGAKPGRKLLDDEAKNKRTAQNRAAQRAFRERKERKMKELEEKVKNLEQMNQNSMLETEFLRSQLSSLVSELKRYRPEKDSDVQVLDYLAKHEEAEKAGEHGEPYGSVKRDSDDIEANIRRKMDFTFAFPWKGRKDTDAAQFPSPGSSMVSSSSTSVNSSSSMGRRRSSQRTNSENSANSNKNSLSLGSVPIINQTPSSRSNSSSTSGTGWMDNMFYNDDARQLPQFASGSAKNESVGAPLNYDSTLFSNQFNFDDQFDEQVSEFCSKMNQACGTKECPILSNKSLTGLTPVSVGNDATMRTRDLVSPSLLTNSWDTKTSPAFGQTSFPSGGLTPGKLTNEFPAGDGFTFAYDDNDKKKQDLLPFIDANIAFPNEDDEGLFFRENPGENNLFSEFLDDTEANDAVDNFVNDNLINEEPAATSRQQQDKQTPEKDVVPSRDGKLLKCSEVWDRITAHPKYSSIDIDGLCGELMTKAKCSEKGVVVEAEDVQSVLDRHMSKKQPQINL
ncbi:hypothetical protein HG536_0A05470 [Torulaspora globosa]|uniref:BZIP domain-containing protein n=1 Tax=Torulaspora globosa TaxID=48254 RepID=A0A7G3ZB46_9SACH|nr:uncharacterized protein HG536_0A05470 [Torulaspora globosa]QLL30732.1 hypothetical protein HG536_0A05470 [Torulaspora globosa]